MQRNILIVILITLATQSGCKGSGVSALSGDALSDHDVNLILDQAEAAANATPSLVRVDDQGNPQMTRMHIMVMNRNGRTVGRRSMPDAWRGSVSIAVSKAFTAMAFSSDQNALTSRSIGALSQPGGPLWNIGNSNQGMFDPGLIEFAGGVPLYKNGKLVGGIGVSGDGIDQDETVALAGAKGFEAPTTIRIDTVTDGSVPYVKED
jgi:uncharacterized protein GlcG (DUF336 family)